MMNAYGRSKALPFRYFASAINAGSFRLLLRKIHLPPKGRLGAWGLLLPFCFVCHGGTKAPPYVFFALPFLHAVDKQLQNDCNAQRKMQRIITY